ncbi:MAG: DinB family protein [Candidatus Eiseniibacteriota bacterium]
MGGAARGGIDDLDRNAERAARLRNGALTGLGRLTEEQLNWRTEPGSWSPGECVLHVNLSNRLFLDAIERRIQVARERGLLREGPFRYGWLDRWFVRELEPPVRRRVRAPRIFRPQPRRAGASDIAELGRLLQRAVAAMHAAKGVDLARVKVASPVSPLIRWQLGTAFQIIVAHSDRHLQQAERVMQNPAFPGGGRA